MLCGSCAYVCPSNIPLSQLFQASKAALRRAARPSNERHRPTPRSSSRRRRTSRPRDSTPRIMWNVVGSLVPVIAASAWFFGVSALLVIAAATLGALLTERAFGQGRHRSPTARRRSPGSCSASRFPPGMPLWMAFVGGAFGDRIRQGGLGRARAERVQPGARRPRVPAGGVPGGDHHVADRRRRILLAQGRPVRGAVHCIRTVDAVTSATPLGLLKFEGKGTALAASRPRQHRRVGGRDGGARHPRRRRVPRAARLSQLAHSGEHPAHRGGLQRRSCTCAGPAQARRAVHALLRRPDARRGLHGDRHGDVAGDEPRASGSSASASACWWS